MRRQGFAGTKVLTACGRFTQDEMSKKVERPICSAWVFDTHTNKLMAVLAPGLHVDSGDEFSKARNMLYRWWGKFWKHFAKVSKGCRRIVTLGGDVGEFDSKQYSNQLVTRNECDIKGLVLETLKEPLALSDDVYVLGGTGAHGGKGCGLERWLADDIGATFLWNMYAEFNGVLVDASHHCSATKKEWTKGNAANGLAAETVMRYANSGDPIPQFVFRGHVHHYQDSFNNIRACRAVIAPCWTFHDEYAQRLGLGNSLPDIGGLILTCKNGVGELEVWLRRPIRVPALKI